MRLIIFDVDGTLVDSQHDIVEAQARAFADHGLPAPSRERALSVVGLSLHEAFVRLAGPGAPIAGLAESYKAAWTELRMRPGWTDTLYPGAAALIADLARAPDILLGIATGKSIRGVERLLAAQGWGKFFATVQTADAHPSKPDPSMILAALAETGIEPDASVMIGDTSYDIEMARTAGVTAIGVAWGYHEAASLLTCGATEVVDDFDALQSALETFGAARTDA